MHPAQGALSLDRRESGKTAFAENFASIETANLTSASELVSLTLIIDDCSVEVFAEDGLTTLTDLVSPEQPYTQLTVTTNQGQAELLSFEVVG